MHPVVARLCDPIEGTDAAHLAECLGLYELLFLLYEASVLRLLKWMVSWFSYRDHIFFIEQKWTFGFNLSL